MKRLHQRCALASAGLHLLLVLTFLLGSAFQRPRDKAGDPAPARQGDGPPIQILPIPAGAEAPSAAVAQAGAVPRPNAASRETPVVMPRERDSINPDAPRRRTPRVSTNLTTRVRGAAGIVSNNGQAATDSRAEQLGQAADNILKMITPGTRIEFGDGSGTGDGARSYAQIVKEAYAQSWDPRGVAVEDGIAKATVSIASDGKILAAQIVSPSGNVALDQSVRRALNGVRSIEPFEPGAREKQRTFRINFDLKARQSPD
jgi:TonB family protein